MTFHVSQRYGYDGFIQLHHHCKVSLKSALEHETKCFPALMIVEEHQLDGKGSACLAIDPAGMSSSWEKVWVCESMLRPPWGMSGQQRRIWSSTQSRRMLKLLPASYLQAFRVIGLFCTAFLLVSLVVSGRLRLILFYVAVGKTILKLNKQT